MTALYHAKSLAELRRLDEHHLCRAESVAIEQISKIRAQLNSARSVTDPEWAIKANGALIHWGAQHDLIEAVRAENATEPDLTSRAFRRLYATVNDYITTETPDALEGVRLAMNQLNDYLTRET